MEFRRRKPRGPLAGFVELLWYWNGPARPHAFERLLPDGSMELVINLREDEIRVYDRRDLNRFERLESAALVGPHSEYFVIDTAEQGCVMGVHFRPGGAFPFMRLPACELHGQHVSMCDLWGGFARELRDRVLCAQTIEHRFDVLESALTARAARPLAHHPAVAYALREFCGGGTRTVADVIDTTGLSARRFIELFKHQIGMPPKQYCRVQRFQRVICGLGPPTSVDWADVAAENGYFDQAHLIHEFRAISGLTPCEYLGLRTEHLNHVPIHV
ncbi:MAG TPA: helix-turn-helix domain-containing protein [Candidatus Solibacter sp.]|nr:helix-turn-helix domain-containing protein [Candidatus Solibacter sp.]